MSILERRNTAGRVVYKTLEEPWAGSERDKFTLLGYLDQLRRDPALLSSEAVLPDLSDELAPVSMWPRRVGTRRGWWAPGARAELRQRSRAGDEDFTGLGDPVLTVIRFLSR